MNKFFIVSLALAATVSCADDPAAEWVVEISASDRSLPADGSEGANITIGVYDSANDGAPAAQGSVVVMQCSEAGGGATGFFAGSETQGSVTSLTDSVGLVEYRFECSGDTGEDYAVNCIALANGATAVMIPQIVCETSLEE